MIKYIFATTLLIMSLGVLLTNCDSQDSITQPTQINQIDQLSEDDVFSFKSSIIRFVGRKPEDASHENKFNAYFDGHYLEQTQTHTLRYYAKEEGKEYFVLTRIAPSVQLKYVAIGGFVVFDENNEVKEIEEVFRTWKKIPEELDSINNILFQKMVNGDDLSPYYTKSMGQDAYIEFPNDEVWYDKKSNTWESSREDVLREFYDEKVKRTQQKIDSLNIQ
jgi:hypothetical protein